MARARSIGSPMTSTLRDFVMSGRIADVALAAMALEAVLLFFMTRRLPSIARVGIAANLLAGATLVLAVRFALTSDGWPFVVAAFCGSLVCHATDLWVRWRSI